LEGEEGGEDDLDFDFCRHDCTARPLPKDPSKTPKPQMALFSQLYLIEALPAIRRARRSEPELSAHGGIRPAKCIFERNMKTDPPANPTETFGNSISDAGLQAKCRDLAGRLSALGEGGTGVAVGFSGGADSVLLAAMARRVLGRERV